MKPETLESWHSQLPCLAFSIKEDSVETKPASSLVESMGKALNGIPRVLSGRQLAITRIKQMRKNAVVPSALDYASKCSHNELHADIPVWDSSKKNK